MMWRRFVRIFQKKTAGGDRMDRHGFILAHKGKRNENYQISDFLDDYTTGIVE
jgi:hypothetical protein